MKKASISKMHIAVIFLFAGVCAKAQWSTTSAGGTATLNTQGNVSIGGNIILKGDSYVSAATTNNFTAYSGGTNYTNGGTIVLRGSTSPTNPFGMEFYTAGVSRLTIGTDGTVKAAGNLSVGGNISLQGDSYVSAATTNNFTAFSGGTNYTNGGTIVLRGSTSPTNPFGMEFYTAGVSRMTIGTDGTVKAAGNLSVGGNITLQGDSYVSAAATNNFTAYSGGTNYTNGGTMVLRGSTSASNPFGVEFYTSGTQRMVIEADGGVRIGSITTPNPTGYKLYVDQGILTEKVKVAVAGSAQWADYVFAQNYKLMPLTDVEQFVKTNKHLPNVPSADEMVKEGNDLGKTTAKLLEKIEELTLYMIEMGKRNDAVVKKMDSLEAKNKKLSEELEQLKKGY